MSSIGPVPSGEIALYEAPDGQVRLDVRIERETVWLSQAQMAELFGRERSVITRHLNNVFGEGELAKESNMQKLHIASSDKPVAGRLGRVRRVQARCLSKQIADGFDKLQPRLRASKPDWILLQALAGLPPYSEIPMIPTLA